MSIYSMQDFFANFKPLFVVVFVLLVTIAFIGVVSAPLLPMKYQKINQAKAELQQLSTALSNYYADKDRYPQYLLGLIIDEQTPTASVNYLGLNALPKDPWGNDYQYHYPSLHGKAYDLFSFGADGKQGGKGEDADIRIENTL